MQIEKIQTVTVFVSDQDRALTFYTDVLGFTVKNDQSFGDNRWLEVGPAEGTSMVLHKPFPGMTAGSSQGMMLATTDVTSAASTLRSAGVVVDGPQDMPWGKQATFSDPDGNGFVLSGK
ncbi:MAG: VOC family protein [Micrococcaceae bacterium]|uniref:VOC family protein n=1 Tax=Arthrobacter rhombi TaxID=71253 RepID=UPI002654A9B5|nr:VOC family protein [Micrococcaceae bacterium]